MARKNVLQEGKKKSWKFYTIISSIVALVAAGAIVLSIFLYIDLNTDTYRNRFTDYTDEKINVNQLDDIFEADSTGYNLFIFAYDENFIDEEVYKDLESDDPNRKIYEEANLALANFFKAIEENHKLFKDPNANEEANQDKLDKNNNKDKYVEFYIINASLTGNDTFLSDEKYGNMGKAPSLVYFNDGTYQEKDKEERDVLSGGKGDYAQFTLVLKDATDYINNITKSMTA